MKDTMIDFAKQKLDKIRQDPEQRPSVENIVADRKAEEQYCLRVVEYNRLMLPTA